jgi:hypothetical protein
LVDAELLSVHSFDAGQRGESCCAYTEAVLGYPIQKNSTAFPKALIGAQNSGNIKRVGILLGKCRLLAIFLRIQNGHSNF